MIEEGLVEEVSFLLKQGYPKDAKAFQALGYKETIQYLDGSIDLEEMIELIKNRRIKCFRSGA